MNVEIKDSKRYIIEPTAAFITFKYSPQVVDFMKSISVRYYHPDTHEWEVPIDMIEYIQNNAPERVKIMGNTTDNNKEYNNIPKEFSFVTEPFNHQIEGVNYGLTHTRFILGDEMGLGKTKQMIDTAVCNKIKYGYKHCLIICCVNGLKWNWYNEVKKHSNESAYILGTRYLKNKMTVKNNAEKYEDLLYINNIDSYFIITNVETLRSPDITDRLNELCKQRIINMIIVDECHKCANPTSQQSKGLLKLNAEYKALLSGTPLINNPLDLYLPLRWLGYEQHSFYQFKMHHCIYEGYGGHEIMGYKNLDELKFKLKKIMLRRLKSDVLDLPDKTYVDEYVELSDAQRRLYNEVYLSILDDIDRVKLMPNPLAQLIRLRQVTGCPDILSSKIKENAKIDRLKEIVQENTENGHKVVIFSNWVQVIQRVYTELMYNKYNPATVTGEQDTIVRIIQQSKFQNDETCKCIVGTIGAMGTGLTLTAGTVIIFIDEPWTRASYEQAVDRCHRIGTKGNITIYNLIAKDTIDERIHEIIYKKGLMSDHIVDDKISNQEMFKLIMQ